MAAFLLNSSKKGANCKMYKFINSLLQRKESNKRIIETCKRHILNSNDDSLIVKHESRRTQFYLSNKDGRTYLPHSSPLIGKLAQKDYYEKVLEAAQRENKWIDTVLRTMPKETVENIFQDDPTRRSLIKPLILNDQEFVAQWESVTYERKPFYPGQQTFPTDKGDLVKSKSEALIANKLFQMGIPYRYEYPLELSGYGVVYPDFTILDVKERKEYIVEHLGMLDNPQYETNALTKLATYERNGYFDGDKLILTLEDSKHPLDTNSLEKLLRARLHLYPNTLKHQIADVIPADIL